MQIIVKTYNIVWTFYYKEITFLKFEGENVVILYTILIGYSLWRLTFTRNCT